ncbi:nuclear pore complex protein Nup75-like [Scaptodrosophila lebanonensis]|uniref:Nuclear pore complex protein Nup75 n=1 Tax=Drosophila lebanonensis TaxID=7225 RepID=A0A6J2TWA2_DROLE|nr:nuclear pore complex protein Nup75-like [Scaptodrosophila lebanonensis]
MSDPPVFELGDKLATRCGNTLSGTFLPNNKMALSAYRHKNTDAFGKPEEPEAIRAISEDPVLIYIAEETSLYGEPLLRSLLAEANTTFTTLQKLDQKAAKAEFVNISQAYRSIVRACLEKLELAKATPEVLMDEQRLHCTSDAITTFYAIECLWQLFEILYIQGLQKQIIVPQLLDWTRFHFPLTEGRATDLLLMAEEASDSDDYWSTLKTLIMLGEVGVTAAILTQNRKANRGPFEAAINMLKAMPLYQHGYAMQKFCSQWEFWRAEGERKIAANMFAAEPELEILMELVVGNTEKWDAGLAQSNDWYEFLPGYLLYTNPTCKPFELRMVATAWLNRWSRVKPDWEMKSMSRMIMQLMQHDLKMFLYESQRLNDSHWFATHLIDLIHHSGQLNAYCQQQKVDLPSLRQSMLLEFGSYLMTSLNLWQLGIDYLDSCGQEGYKAIETILSHIPLKSERLSLKLIALAKQRNLADVEQTICKVLARRCYDEQRFSSALEWAIRSKDPVLVNGITDFILKNYSETGIMLCKDVITYIGARMFISPRLVFLCKYFEFYELYRKRDFLPAAELLINLLDSKITPTYFWPSLLMDSLPLLESKDPKLFSKETITILRYLELELEPLIERNKRETAEFAFQTSKTVLRDYRVENIEELVRMLRYACSRNLARTFIIEGTASSNK